MKRLLILILIAIPLMAQSQTVIDRAMSVWARNVVNDNFTEIFDRADSIIDNADNLTLVVDTINLQVDTLYADIDTLESQIDSSLVVFNYRDSTIAPLTEDLTISADFAGLLGTKVTNTNSDAVAVAGAVHQLTNDLGYWSLIGMTSSASTILGSAFINTFHFYNQGYANTLLTVDGNKDFVWYTDPTDQHDFTALSNEVMRLGASGILTVDTIVTDSIKTRVLDYDPPHGVMVFADSAQVISLTQNIWAKITNAQDSLYAIIEENDITVDGDSITIVIPGDYMISVTMSFNGGPSDVYHMAFYVNNVITRFESHRKTSNNDTGYFAINGYLDNLAAGDDICVKIRNTGDNDDPTLISSQWIINMLHPK